MLYQLVFMARQYMAQFAQNEEGQDLAEYGLVMVLIAIAAIVAMGLVGDQISTVFDNVKSALGA